MPNRYSLEDKELLNKIGRRIRKIRSDANLSQEKLALLCELDRTYIGSVERGERNISIINLQKISNALHVEISDFLKRAE